MQINNRQEDLTKVFDRNWKANHNDDVKNAREKERSFINRLFNVKEDKKSSNNSSYLTPNDRVNNLQNNMNSLNNFNNNIKVNNITKKWQ